MVSLAKKGYTKIENNIFSYLYRNDLNASELKVLLFLIRYTAGFNRQTTRASYRFIAEGTNLSPETCRKAIKKLCGKNLIRVEYQAIGSKAQVVQVLYKNLTTLCTRVGGHEVQESEEYKVQELEDQDIKEYIKDKDIKEEEKASPTFSSEEEWRAWMETQDVEED